MQGHPIAPDRSAALDDHKRAAGDDWQRRERLGGGDGGEGGDGVDDGASNSRSIYLEESHSSRLILALLKISASRQACTYFFPLMRIWYFSA